MKTNSESSVPKRVLVIDDEICVLTVLERVLRNAGYEVRTAQSGHEGVRLFKEGQWDAVTVDRAMPDLDGEDVTKEIKRLAPNLPVLLITGFPGAVTHPALFHAILSKPFRGADLLQCLDRMLTRSAAVNAPPPPQYQRAVA